MNPVKLRKTVNKQTSSSDWLKQATKKKEILTKFESKLQWKKKCTAITIHCDVS